MATLVLKLGTALLKQVSKPAAKALTNYVLERPSLRQYVVRAARVCISPAAGHLPYMLTH